jgi:DNA-binding SARP family transcriptional activator
MTGNTVSHEHGGLDIRLLGPLSVHLNHRPVTPSAAKQRQILALLVLNAGRVATVSTLVEELWGDHPPRSWATTLQTYILQLRNRLAAAAGHARDARRIIATRHGGYLLDAPVYRSDVGEFKRLARSGREITEAGDHRGASDLLGRALALWRGPALVDVRTGRILELEAASLEETRLGVLERRIEADLVLGRHADVLGELTMLTARNPMNENFCGLLMAALYRSGHAGRALDVFARLRAVLSNELGIEPGPRLQRLQRAVLSGDPGLDTGPLPRPAAQAGRERHGGRLPGAAGPSLPRRGPSAQAS